MTETGKSESWVSKCVKIDSMDVVRSGQAMLGYDDDDVTF